MKSESSSCCTNFLRNTKHHIGMISLQFGYAGNNIITKISLNGGMSHYVLVAYRHAFATAAIAPFAFYFERRAQPKITFRVFMQIFFLALLGPVIDQNFYYAGLKLTSPTFACAISNMLPALTFIMAFLFRMEKINIKKVISQAKLVGTAITVIGAMLMTLYKGPEVYLFWSKHTQAHSAGEETSGPSDREWFIGCILLIIATLAWSSLFILQKAALETYSNHQLSLTSLVCFVGTLQAIIATFIMEHKASVWQIGWDMNLLAAAYAGIVTSSISYYVQGLVMEAKGPVFATAFSPLMMIIVAIMGSFMLEEQIYLGGVVGSIIIVVGLYSVLWGKHKEGQEEKMKKKLLIHLPEVMKDTTTAQLNNHVLVKIENNETNGNCHGCCDVGEHKFTSNTHPKPNQQV